MADLYRAYILLVAIMVTSFVANGGLALWAAASRRHRLLHVVIVLLVPAPLLLRQAYDLYAVFAIQSVLVITGVALHKGRAARRSAELSQSDGDSWLLPRFSLFTLLALMAATAIGLTAVIQLPKWENLAWRTVLVSGAGGATGTLTGAWICNSKLKWITAPLAVVICVAIGMAVSKLDWFFEATLQMAGWPPRPFTPASFMGSPANYDDFDAWTFIPLLIALTTALLIFLWRAAGFTRNEPLSNEVRFVRRRAFARAAFAVLAIIVGAIPLSVMTALLLPAPLPTVTMPVPNGNDDFLRAAKISGAMNFNYVSKLDSAPVDKLSPLIADAEAIDVLVKAGLSKSCYVPMNYFSPAGGFSEDKIGRYDLVAMALSAKGRLAVLENRYDDAANIYLRASEFGYRSCRGAMVWEGSLIHSRSAYGTRALYAIRDALPTELLAHCVHRLVQIDAADEPMKDVLYRYRVWAERRSGWHGHLKYLLEKMVVNPGNGLSSDYWHCETFRDRYRRSHAITRLLICELALKQFYREHDRNPDSLVELVPKYLPAIPVDPFHPQNAPLRYRRDGNGYLLYSLHEDGIDHGGRPTHPAAWDVTKFRDLRLEYAFSK